jgi:tryptophanyl-tRNA synthetase
MNQIVKQLENFNSNSINSSNVEKNQKKIALTGDRPTGKLHLGHYVGSLMNRIKLQDVYQQYIMVADLQALTDNFENPEKINQNILEVVKDYLSVGLSENKNIIFLQSQITELTELTFYYMNLVNLGRLERNPTVKAEIQQKGYNDELPVGFLCYPVSQAADISLFKAEVVPVGNDQLPILEVANDIIRKFNRIYKTNCLVECEAYLNEDLKSQRLVGIDGNAKASKSLGNAIFLSDEKEDVRKKVFSMYTDPDHIKISDPGKVEGNVVFAYLDAFHDDKDELESLKVHYQRGGLGDTTIKEILNNTLQSLLEPIREKRNSLSDEFVRGVLINGTEKAKESAKKTMFEVRSAMGISFFSR